VKRGRAPYLLSGLVAAAALLPVAVLIYQSLGAEPLGGGRTLEVLLNTVLLVASTVAASLAIGAALAFVTAYGDLPFRRFWTAALALPMAVPSYVGAFAFFASFGPGGELEALLGLTTPSVHGYAGATLVMTLYTYPFVMLTTRASLKGLDADVFDAARTLGLSTRSALLRVVLPRVKSGVATGGLLVALYTLSDFGTPAIMRFDTFTRVIFVEYNAFGLDRAALLSTYLLALAAVVVFLESRVSTAKERPGRSLELGLGRWRGAALLPALLVVSAAILLPVGVFFVWLLREGFTGFDPAYVLNSLYPSLLAAAVAVLAALPVAYVAPDGVLGRVLEKATYVGFGAPGIVVGTAFVFVGVRIAPLYQTVALLVFAYVVRFLPLAVGSTRSSVERATGELEGAARSLGASPLETYRRVTLPLAVPGMVAGGALVFLTAMRELPATLLLRPSGFETLSTYIWTVYEAGYFGRGALPALVLVLTSGLSVVLMLSGENQQTLS